MKNMIDVKRDRNILFIIILLYMLCMVPLAGSFPSYSRFGIIPLLIIISLKSKESHAKVDWNTTILFLIGAAPSIFYSQYSNNALLKMATVTFMFIGCSMYFSSKKRSGVLVLYQALLLFSYVSIYSNLYRLLTGGGFTTGYFRGYFGNRNAAAAAFVISFCILLTEAWKRRKKFCIISLIINIILIVMTQSRGGFLAMLIALIIGLHLNVQQLAKRIKYYFIFIVLVIVLWSRVSEWVVVKRLLSEGIGRNELWNYATGIIHDHLLFGAGFSSSQFLNELLGNEGYSFHNSYISLLADVGLWGIIWIAVMFVRIGIRIKKRALLVSKEYKDEYLALLAICISFLGLSFGEGYLIVAGSSFSFTFWCCMFCLSSFDETYELQEMEE